MTTKTQTPVEGDNLDSMSTRDRWKATTKLQVLATKNPKKPGSMAHERFEGYFTLKGDCVVQDALDAGLRMDDIRHDSAHGFIHLGDGPIVNREMVEGDL